MLFQPDTPLHCCILASINSLKEQDCQPLLATKPLKIQRLDRASAHDKNFQILGPVCRQEFIGSYSADYSAGITPHLWLRPLERQTSNLKQNLYLIGSLSFFLQLRPRFCMVFGCPSPKRHPEAGEIVEIPQVGGLHHRYERRAA